MESASLKSLAAGAVAATVAFVSGCATGGAERIDEASIYRQHAGAPVTSVRYTRMRGWHEAGRGDVVIEFSGSEYYLIDLEPRCELEIGSAMQLALLGQSPNRLHRFDRVQVGHTTVCRIVSIRPIEFRDALDEIQRRRAAQDSGGT